MSDRRGLSDKQEPRKEEMFDRKALFDIYELKTNRSVRHNLVQPVLMVCVNTSMIGKDVFLKKFIEHLLVLFPVLAVGLCM